MFTKKVTLCGVVASALLIAYISLSGPRNDPQRLALDHTASFPSSRPSGSLQLTPTDNASASGGDSWAKSARTSSAGADQILMDLKEAVRTRDEQEAGKLVRDLIAQLSTSPNLIPEIIKALAVETDREFAAALEFSLKRVAAHGDERVAAILLEVATRGGSSLLREISLDIMAELAMVSHATAAAVGHFAAEDSDRRIRIGSIAALAAWIPTNREKAPALSRFLVRSIDASSDPEVRGIAMQSLALQDINLPTDVLNTLSRTMLSDPTPENRAMSAMVFGGATGKDRTAAIIQLENALRTERDTTTRRHILTQLARVAGNDFISLAPRLNTLPLPTPLLRDVQDFRSIYASGLTDFDSVFEEKLERELARKDVQIEPHR